MVNNNSHHYPSLWTRIHRKALRHVSGLVFCVEERSGVHPGATGFMLTVATNSLPIWQDYEMATGTSFTALNKRMSQLQGEALTWHQSQLGNDVYQVNATCAA